MLPIRLLLIGVISILSLFAKAQCCATGNDPNCSQHKLSLNEPNAEKNYGVLVSFQPDVDANELLAKYPELVSGYGLTVNRKVSYTMNIWHLGHHSHFEAGTVIQALYGIAEVSIAQLNHPIQKRSNVLVPNDAYYGQQWQYHNDGRNGGLAGADISAELAWYITTGGVTPNGDTIVVAIIDDGMDTTIADLMPNWWHNNKEIPRNNIDDDGNGFIDDYRGWNAFSNNDRIFIKNSWDAGGYHGSPVAGIIGAKGGDSSGVTGVNWNVKLMVIAGGGDEAEAIAAYDYALQNRKLYNATGGAKGAYVVATNSSWGVDELFAVDAPLWCAFYDSLGKAGIASAGATANENWNIEVKGDMPTSCPSDYLIAVTNTKRNDQKEVYAGYGSISVDLGAPGEDAYTVDIFDGFAGFGGTSGATPHVAGAIALLYSVPNQEFADYAAANPDSAALWVKRFILEGVDTISSLRNKTVTGGRLNLFGAMEKMYQYFPDEPVDTSTPIGIADVWGEEIQVYPNPAINEVVVQLPITEAVDIRLVAMDGQLLSQLKPQTATRFVHVPMENLATGIYVLEIVNGKGAKAYRKVAKQ